MARKPALSIETLTELGAERLARLVFDEAERSAPFRKLVSAALASRKGPEAVAKIIDRRLGALEKARGFIDWDKARAFRDDLAAERLLRFIATHEPVFERVDDSSGYVQGVYYDGIAALGVLAPRLGSQEAAHLPDRIMASLGVSSHGYLVDVAKAVAEHLPEDVLRRWDADLTALQREREAEGAKAKDRFRFSNASQYRMVRQLIAGVLGDLDGLIALEEKKHPNAQERSALPSACWKRAGRARRSTGCAARRRVA